LLSEEFRSISGNVIERQKGKDDLEEKRRALEIIMRQYSKRSFLFPEQALAGTTVIRVAIESMTGKQAGYYCSGN
jgi:hypothetical protein